MKSIALTFLLVTVLASISLGQTSELPDAPSAKINDLPHLEVTVEPNLNRNQLRQMLDELCESSERTTERVSKYDADVTPGFPPFDNVDDPRTPDYPCDLIKRKGDPLHGDIEANFFAQGDRAKGGPYWFQLPYFDLNYGTGIWKFRHLQLKVEGGYSYKTDGGRVDQYRTGMGNMLAGIKWMFYDGDAKNGALKNLAMGFYPQVQFAPSSTSVKNNIAEGGKIYIFPFLMTKEVSLPGDRPLGFTFNTGYQHGTGSQPDSVYVSGATGLAVTPMDAVMVSASRQNNFNYEIPKVAKFEGGWVHSLPRDYKVFAMAGVADDGKKHFIWNVGLQKTFHTKSQKAMEAELKRAGLKQ